MTVAVFRADAAPSIGGGHVVRCLALAEALAERGWRCVFACRPGTREVVALLDRAPVEVLTIDESPDREADSIGRCVGAADLLVVDHYERGAAFEAACRGWARRILAIDDHPTRPHDCDVLLDQTYGRRAAEYAERVPPGCRLLCGCDYAMLRPGFAEWRPFALQRRDAGGGSVQRLLITLGASDPGGVTARALRALARCRADLAVDVLVGRADPEATGLAAIARSLPQAVRFHGFDSDPAALMAEADLAIGAAGSGVWERCCLGLPSLLMVTADNQRDIAGRLESAGLARVVDAEALPAVLDGCLDDAAWRAELARAAAQVCDGRGVLRVLAALQKPEFDRSGRRVTARLARLDDADTILAWQQAPGTRRYARRPHPPTPEEHRNWMHRQVVLCQSTLLMVLCDGELSGLLRFHVPDQATCAPSDGSEISIALAPDARGHGVGLAALRLATALMAGRKLLAHIHPENTASQAAFLRAGFRACAPGWFEHPADASEYEVF